MKIKLFFMMCLLALIASCSSKNTFVINKDTIDPFTIYSYPSLAVPPVYYLSAQEIIDERRFASKNRQFVQSLLFGNKIDTSMDASYKKTDAFNPRSVSQGELKFLEMAEANKSFGDIRDQVDKETLGIIKEKPGFIRKIFSSNKGEALDDSFAEYKKYNHK
jgi:hypothetical protein